MSAGNEQKTSLVQNLNRFVDVKTDDFNQLLGKRIPASVVSVDDTGTIVTIKFEIQSDVLTIPNLTCPLATTQWQRVPMPAGTRGYVVPADYYMGGMSDLGGGVATFDQQPNLSNSVFVPVGSAELDPTDDPNWQVLIGPEGVLLRTEDSTVSVLLTKDGGVIVNAPLGGNQFKVDGLVVANDDTDAKSKGIPKFGFYQDPDGVVHCQRLD